MGLAQSTSDRYSPDSSQACCQRASTSRWSYLFLTAVILSQTSSESAVEKRGEALRPVVAVTTTAAVDRRYLDPPCDLHTLMDTYTLALERAGASPVLVGRMRPEDAPLILDRVDGLVASGGRDLAPALYGQDNTASAESHPGDDRRDIALVLEARRRKMPVLGICRGLQAVNAALGGELHQHMLSDSDPEHPTFPADTSKLNFHRHTVELEAGCRLAAVYGSTERKVNSIHHQAVSRAAPGLKATGRTPGGSIEAVESADPGWPLLAVQWHPEMLDPGDEHPLFAAFVEDVRRYLDGRRP